jgi:hypothetical protein
MLIIAQAGFGLGIVRIDKTKRFPKERFGKVASEIVQWFSKIFAFR